MRPTRRLCGCADHRDQGRLADRIVLNSCGLAELEGATALVYETLPEIEARVETWHRTEPTGDDLRAVRAAVWNAFAEPGTLAEPVILTSPAARPLLRKALNFELPDVHVLAHPEMPPEVTVQRIGVVAALPDA